MKSRMPGAFDDGEFEDDDQMRDIRMRKMREEKQYMDEDVPDDSDNGMQDVLDYEDVKGKLSIWVTRPEVRRWIRKMFGLFLRTTTDQDDFNKNIHEQKI